MSERARVYVATRGVYTDAYMAGVYSSPELAIAAHHRDGMTWTESSDEGLRRWMNDKDWGDFVCIDEMEVVGECLPE